MDELSNITPAKYTMTVAVISAERTRSSNFSCGVAIKTITPIMTAIK